MYITKQTQRIKTMVTKNIEKLKEIASNHSYETALALCSIRLAVIIVTLVTLVSIG